MFFYHNSCINVVSSTCIQAINWHNRFGHVSDNVLKILSNKIPFALPNEFSTKSCYVCPIAKFHRLSLPSVNHVSAQPFDLIHCDIWGPYKHSTYANYQYFLTIVDDCSRFTWIFLVKHISEASTVIMKFFAMVKTQFAASIKCLRSDNAQELALTDFLASQGTLHQFSCVERPQQNFVVEWKHQHLLNVARALFFQSKVPITFWGECVVTVAFLINKLPSPLLKQNTPYQVLYCSAPDYSILRSFGCLAFAATLNSERNKFSPRAVPFVFVGYPQGIKGYRLYNLQTRKFYVSRDLVFHENIFPFQTLPNTSQEHNFLSDLVVSLPILESMSSTIQPRIIEPNISHATNNLSIQLSDSAVDTSINASSALPSPSLRRSIRTSNPPPYLLDYIRPQP